MTKRDYMRMDPDWVERKEAKGYPDGAIAAFGKLLGAAEGQNPRGFFKNSTVLRGHLGKHARWVKYLLDRKDLVELPDGRLYVDGWEEWQEGDWKVRERVQRIRNRQKPSPNGTPPTVTKVTVKADTDAVTAGVSPVTPVGVSLPSDVYEDYDKDYYKPPVVPLRLLQAENGNDAGYRLATAIGGFMAGGNVSPAGVDRLRDWPAEFAALFVDGDQAVVDTCRRMAEDAVRQGKSVHSVKFFEGRLGQQRDDKARGRNGSRPGEHRAEITAEQRAALRNAEVESA